MEVDEKFLLDWAAKIGVQAKFDGMTKAQLEGILASLGISTDEKVNLLLTAAFAHRQAVRLDRGHNAARLISEALNNIFQTGKGRENARKLLGVAKWVFETVENIRLPRIDVPKLTFEEYLKLLRGEATKSK